MKLILAIKSDDDVLKPDGPLSKRSWDVGSLTITLKSGYGENSDGTPFWREPSIFVHAKSGFYEPPDWRAPFNAVAFNAALTEAQSECEKMKQFLRDLMAAAIKANGGLSA